MTNRKLLALPYIFWALFFIIFPLLLIIGYAFSNGDGGITLSNVLAIFDKTNSKALLMSLEIALACTVICILLAYPLAMILRKINVNKNSFMTLIVILPMWMNFVLRILAWKMILSQNGIINNIFESLGLPLIDIINTPAAIIIGSVYDFLPYMILPIYNSLMAIDDDLIDAAKDLGANWFNVLRKIIIPLTVPGIVSGVSMVFVPSMTSFVISDILGGGKVQLIGNIIEQEFTQSMNWDLGSGLSVALMAFVLASMFFVQKNDEMDKGNQIW